MELRCSKSLYLSNLRRHREQNSPKNILHAQRWQPIQAQYRAISNTHTQTQPRHSIILPSHSTSRTLLTPTTKHKFSQLLTQHHLNSITIPFRKSRPPHLPSTPYLSKHPSVHYAKARNTTSPPTSTTASISPHLHTTSSLSSKTRTPWKTHCRVYSSPTSRETLGDVMRVRMCKLSGRGSRRGRTEWGFWWIEWWIWGPGEECRLGWRAWGAWRCG